MEPPRSQLVGTLRRVPLFTDLSDEEMTLIARSVSRLRFDRGATIFLEGDACHELLIVEEGTVKIFKSAASGRQQLIGIERAGNSLAEVPVFDGGRSPATAEAAVSTVLLRLPVRSVPANLPSKPRTGAEGFQSSRASAGPSRESGRGVVLLYCPGAFDRPSDSTCR